MAKIVAATAGFSSASQVLEHERVLEHELVVSRTRQRRTVDSIGNDRHDEALGQLR
jgi:hypothetical protein